MGSQSSSSPETPEKAARQATRLASSTKSLVGLAAIVFLVGGLSAWFGFLADTGTSKARVELNESPIGESAPPALPETRFTETRSIAPRPFHEDPEPTERSVLVSSRSSILVLVRWASADKEAAGVPVRLSETRENGRPRFQVEAVTDGLGIVLFEKLRQGRYRVETCLGGDGTVVALEGEGETSATLVIPRGADVDGVVLDQADLPVADARIWLSYGAGGPGEAVVANTGVDGRFHLDSVSCQDSKLIGARLSGLSPSPAHILLANPGVTLNVRLRLGEVAGAIRGRVTDMTHEKAVAGALIVVGKEERSFFTLDDGSRAAVPPPSRGGTDAKGEFELSSVQPGSVPILVRAPGFAEWKGVVDVVARTTTDLSIELKPASILTGTVVDGQRRPVEGAEVRVTDQPEAAALTGPDGSYRIAGITLGEFEAVASLPSIGSVSSRLQVEPGETVFWNPVLGQGLRLVLRLVDQKDQPLAGWMLELEAPAGRGWESKWGTTGTDGRFRLDECANAPYSVSVFEPESRRAPVMRADQVQPGPSETVIRVADAVRATSFITGRVVDPQGNAVSAAMVSARRRSDEPQPVVLTEEGSGRFKLGPVPPGSYTLSVVLRGYASLTAGPRDIGKDETWDVGEIRLSLPGSLVVHLKREDNGALGAPWIFCRSVDRGSYEHLELGADATARSDSLAAGRYQLRVSGVDVVPLVRPVEIRTGETTTVSLVLRIGVKAHLRFSDPPGAALVDRLHATIVDSSNVVVAEADLERHRGFPIEWTLGLPSGSYRVTAASPDGLRTASTPLMIGATRGSSTPIEVSLR